MKKTLFSLFIVALFSTSSLSLAAAESTAQAIVLKVAGSAHSLVEGQSEPLALKAGDVLPQGATIITGPDSLVVVQAFTGAVATIKSSTTVNLEKLSVATSGGKVTKQTALLNLKVGAITSTIDPANHNINDYGIRTPKGVAAARGTVYTVLVNATGKVQVFVTESVVTFTNTVTGQTVTIEAGHQVTVDENGFISAPVPIPVGETPGGKSVGTNGSSDIPSIDVNVLPTTDTVPMSPSS